MANNRLVILESTAIPNTGDTQWLELLSLNVLSLEVHVNHGPDVFPLYKRIGRLVILQSTAIRHYMFVYDIHLYITTWRCFFYVS